MPLGLYCYSIAAIAFLLLAALLATGWRGRGQGVRLIAACLVTAAWAVFMAAAAVVGEGPAYSVALAECVRDGAWILVLAGLAAPAGAAATLGRALNVGWVIGAVCLLVAPAASRSGFAFPTPGVALVATGLMLAIGGLVLLEQLYRNARAEGRHALKHLALALGALWIYDVYLYTQPQTGHAIDGEIWNARGLVATLTVPLVALAARRNPQWSPDIFVSRQVAFYTTTLLAAAVYLSLVAFGDYAIRHYGGTGGGTMRLAFLAGACIVLLTLLASRSLQRRLRVFLSKHFYRTKYDYRVEWLRFIDTLAVSGTSADTQETVVRAIAEIFGSPGGVLYLRRDCSDRFEAVATWPRGRVDLADCTPIPIADDLPSFMARRQWVVDVMEHAAEPELYDHIVLPEPFGATGAHRMILPLLHGPAMLGFLALEAPPPPFHPNFEDRDLLKTVGRHVATHLAQHEADRRLAENRQFEAYHRLTAFVMHDLKNLTAQLALIVANAERHKRNPEFVDDAVSTIANSTAHMQGLIDHLQRPELQGVPQRIALAEVARRAAGHCAARKPVPVLLPDAAEVQVDCDPDRLGVIVEHVIRNAQDATPEDGAVTLSVGVGAATGSEANGRLVPHAVLTVRDTGSGMTREFIQQRLFKPFDTTKGSQGMGIGAFQVREYVQSLGGRIDVESGPGRGTRFTLVIPAIS